MTMLSDENNWRPKISLDWTWRCYLHNVRIVNDNSVRIVNDYANSVRIVNDYANSVRIVNDYVHSVCIVNDNADSVRIVNDYAGIMSV